ncbi:hypothetical protein MTO96_047976 [Rhipicephalus appendiculatus]
MNKIALVISFSPYRVYALNPVFYPYDIQQRATICAECERSLDPNEAARQSGDDQGSRPHSTGKMKKFGRWMKNLFNRKCSNFAATPTSVSPSVKQTGIKIIADFLSKKVLRWGA